MYVAKKSGNFVMKNKALIIFQNYFWMGFLSAYQSTKKIFFNDLSS